MVEDWDLCSTFVSLVSYHDLENEEVDITFIAKVRTLRRSFKRERIYAYK